VNGRRLLGFRAKPIDITDPGKSNVFDVWIDAQTGEPHHVDITHGEDETGRWLAFLKSIAGQGYVPAGTAMEIWTETPDPTDKQGQLTEMRIPVVSAH